MMGNNFQRQSPSVMLTMWKYQTSFSNTVFYHSNSRLSIDWKLRTPSLGRYTYRASLHTCLRGIIPKRTASVSRSS